MRRLVQKLTKAKAPCGTILPFASDRCCHLPTVNSYDYRGNFIPVLYIHIVILGKHGINGWTGEPKEKYYEFRGWDKDIFKENTRKKES